MKKICERCGTVILFCEYTRCEYCGGIMHKYTKKLEKRITDEFHDRNRQLTIRGGRR